MLGTRRSRNNCVGWALQRQNQTLPCSSGKVITSADLGEIDRVKLQLAASFDMKDLGDLNYFLRIEVIRTPEGILISQRHYVLSMLFKFGMADCKTVSTPLDRYVTRRGSKQLLEA